MLTDTFTHGEQHIPSLPFPPSFQQLPFERSQLYQDYIPVPDVPVVYYIHPRIQREDPRVIWDYSVVRHLHHLHARNTL